MKDRTPAGRATLTDRWPTALALVAAAAAVAVIALFDREEEYFGPSIAAMAGIYLTAYAIGRGWTAWPAFVVLSAAVTALQFLYAHGALEFDAPVTMSLVLALLWLWVVARRRFTDGRTFYVQTAGMVGFGALTLVCATVQPRWGLLLAGVGFLATASGTRTTGGPQGRGPFVGGVLRRPRRRCRGGARRRGGSLTARIHVLTHHVDDGVPAAATMG